jgi:hypothetical protein
MGAFASALHRFATQTKADEHAIHQSVAVEVKRSWVEGSPITGAPPLPIATSNAPTVGKLRRGVTLSYPDANTALIYTTVPYAAEIEENPRGVHFTEGGPHGFALTVAGFPRLLETVTRRVTGYR